MEPNRNCCCFTGHRPDHMPWLEDRDSERFRALRHGLWERIEVCYMDGCRQFYCGMAMGVDLLCAELVLELSQTTPEVELIPVLPFPGQCARWPEAEQQRYQQILDQCGDRVVVVSPRYTPSCFHDRNRYMVDHATHVIAVFDGRPCGGTRQTLDYARRRQRKVLLLVP